MKTETNEQLKTPEISISVNVNKSKSPKLQKITSSEDAYKVFKLIFNKDTFDWTEEAIMLCMNRANEVIGFYKVSQGGTTGTVLDPKIVFTIALNSLSDRIILAHNHPSGNLTPSKADLEITKKLKNCGDMLQIPLLDHLICTKSNYTSLSDEGLM